MNMRKRIESRNKYIPATCICLYELRQGQALASLLNCVNSDAISAVNVIRYLHSVVNGHPSMVTIAEAHLTRDKVMLSTSIPIPCTTNSENSPFWARFVHQYCECTAFLQAFQANASCWQVSKPNNIMGNSVHNQPKGLFYTGSEEGETPHKRA
jgi:hypothetical protein